jgi:hypothetical protein
LKKEIEIMKLYIIDLQNKNILGEKKWKELNFLTSKMWHF